MSCLTLSFFSLKMYIDKGLAPSLITLIASLTDSTLTIGKMGPKINSTNINNKITSNSFFFLKKKGKIYLPKISSFITTSSTDTLVKTCKSMNL